ncbi:MAG: hypothetical protein DME50_15720 [Verrucomicrobia bacterium]|nr:MAG: hypothetical protein DME50_15720 [Verrucomicrobiota bacterium]
MLFQAERHQRRHRLRKSFHRSHHAVIRVYDDAGNVIETHEQAASPRSGELVFHRAERLASVKIAGRENK